MVRGLLGSVFPLMSPVVTTRDDSCEVWQCFGQVGQCILSPQDDGFPVEVGDGG